MGLLTWLFGSSSPAVPRPNSKRSLRIVGDGSFDHDVVGESFYQDALSAICGGKTDDGHEVECRARLVPEPENPHDGNAVAVYIRNHKVGHLSRSEATAFNQLLEAHGIGGQQVQCDAMIVGGWDRGRRGQGHFGVKLDIPEDATLTDT